MPHYGQNKKAEPKDKKREEPSPQEQSQKKLEFQLIKKSKNNHKTLTKSIFKILPFFKWAYKDQKLLLKHLTKRIENKSFQIVL